MNNILTFLATRENIAIMILLLCVVPILILMVIAIIIAIRRSIRVNKERNLNIQGEEIDLEQQKLFFNAYGGKDNVLDVIKEMNRITVRVEDMDLVNSEELKNLGATGVLLVGDSVKSSFGDRASYVYNLIEKK